MHPATKRAAQTIPLLLLLAACAASRDYAAMVQFVDTTGPRYQRDGLGLAMYGLGSEQEPLAWFAEVHHTTRGSADGTRVSEPPPSAPGDPLTGRYVDAVVAHFGPCYRATDWLHLYAGAGLGYRGEKIERFNNLVSTEPSGLYHYRDVETWGGSFTAGILLSPGPGLYLGVGYDSWLEGMVFGIGASF